ncbi:hypothetical protein JCM5296_001794 [Sporobolomyces johnsonii]
MPPRKKQKKEWRPLDFDPVRNDYFAPEGLVACSCLDCRKQAGPAGACAVTNYAKKQHAKADKERMEETAAERRAEAAAEAEAARAQVAAAPQRADGGVSRGTGFPWRYIEAEGDEWSEMCGDEAQRARDAEDRAACERWRREVEEAEAEEEALEEAEEERRWETADALRFESELPKAEQDGFSGDMLKLFKLARLRARATSMTRRDFFIVLEALPELAPEGIGKYRLLSTLDLLTSNKYQEIECCPETC